MTQLKKYARKHLYLGLITVVLGPGAPSVFAEIGHAFFRVFLILFVQSFLGGPDGFIHAYAKIMGCHLNGILAEQGGLFQAAGVDEQGESPEKVFTCVNGTVSGAGFHLPVETGMIF